MRDQNRRVAPFILAFIFAAAGCPTGPGGDSNDGPDDNDPQCTSTDALALYERRIEPLVSGQVPNSCSQCHLQGVGLANYVRDTPCQTMACLVDSGEVDLANPEGSVILERILRAEPDSALITADVIQAEHDGFLEWIEFSAVCQDALCGDIDDPCGAGTGAPPPPDLLSPIGGCDEGALLQTFQAKVFSQRGRCNSCHAAYGQGRIDAPEVNGDAPLWIDGASDTPDDNDARNTMYNVIGRGLLDPADPARSLLVLKPLNTPEVPHGGGAKFENTSDATYQSFLSWIRDDYAVCIDEEATEPPPPDVNPTATITHPGDADGPRPAGTPIPWIGNASDPQDGALTGASLVWSSDQSGVFGDGESFDAELPVGTHVVTLTATDSDGNIGTDSIVVVVE